MAAKKKKIFVKLQCLNCKKINYYTHKSKGVEGKLSLKKFCKWCKKNTTHNESRK